MERPRRARSVTAGGYAEARQEGLVPIGSPSGIRELRVRLRRRNDSGERSPPPSQSESEKEDDESQKSPKLADRREDSSESSGEQDFQDNSNSASTSTRKRRRPNLGLDGKAWRLEDDGQSTAKALRERPPPRNAHHRAEPSRHDANDSRSRLRELTRGRSERLTRSGLLSAESADIEAAKARSLAELRRKANSEGDQVQVGREEKDKPEAEDESDKEQDKETKERDSDKEVVPDSSSEDSSGDFSDDEDSDRDKRRSHRYWSEPRRSVRRRANVQRFSDTLAASVAKRRNAFFNRKKIHRSGGSSSDSESSSSSSSASHDKKKRRDKKEKKKDKSVAPGAVVPVPINAVPGQKREKADIDPMAIDTSVTWESIGGLQGHIRALKEMVLFPLIYPELYSRLGITPPRGVLFYGPPGTGKTLVARALANTCSQGGQRVSFFMRKGADILSKWVGEAERQLRLLFDQAYKMQPSIIFFDEIDGLAPVRSSRQDQIHNSIVSTLLALLDGLDNRGNIVVIGATNRIDTIDPALRRPGRFDREFPFTLPSKEARREILKIHTKDWSPPLSQETIDEISVKCVGYCGADIKALVTEASLRMIRRKFPQIYESTQKLLINPSAIRPTVSDFVAAMHQISPASHRSAPTHAAPLPAHLQPLLGNQLAECIKVLQKEFPPLVRGPHATTGDQANVAPAAYRPRLLIAGSDAHAGQSLISAALLHLLEEFPVFPLDLATLHADPSAKSLEEALARAFLEAKRKLPSVLYLPHIDHWFRSCPESLHFVFLSLLTDTAPSLPLLLLATSDVPFAELSDDLQPLFPSYLEVKAPNTASREKFFLQLRNEIAKPVIPYVAPAILPPLPVAPPPKPKALTAEEKKAQEEMDRSKLRDLRMALREGMHRLFADKRFRVFEKPVDPTEVPDYYQVIERPICLDQILQRIDDHCYSSLSQFLDDMYLLVSNAKEYNPVHNDPQRVTSKANHLLDAVEDFAEDVDSDLVRECEKIAERRPKPPPPPKGPPPAMLPPPANETAEQRLKRTSARLRGEQLEMNAVLDVADSSIAAVRRIPRRESEDRDKVANGASSSEAVKGDVEIMEADVLPELPPDPPEPEPVAPVFDASVVDGIVRSLCSSSASLSLEDLNQVYSALYPIIEFHRDAVDKQALLAELSAKVEKMQKKQQRK